MNKYVNIGIMAFLTISLAGCGDAGSKKWQLSNENLTKQEVKILEEAISFKNEFLNKGANWETFAAKDWAKFLMFFPEYANKCDNLNGWRNFDGSDWSYLLSNESRFEKQCDANSGWKLMSPVDWISLLAKEPKFETKSNEYKIWENFNGKDWMVALLVNSEVLEKKCDSNNGWSKLGKDEWITLISKNDKFIESAIKQNGFDTFDNSTWLTLIKTNQKLKKIAEDKGIFKKLTPMEWTNLLSKDPEYITIMKSVSSLNKLSNQDLIRLYCLQPNLRNDIFALNRIDINAAKQIEKFYTNFGENGSELSANALVVILKIFPEQKNKINEHTFKDYNEIEWTKLLRGGKEIYDIISQNYAYLVPWKLFRFSDWCEIVEDNADILGLFNQYVDLKKLQYIEIKTALIEARVKGFTSFDKYNFWKDFTKEQYLFLIEDKDATLVEGIRLTERASGKRAHSIGELREMSKSLKEDIESDDFVWKMSDVFFETKGNPITYDYKYIFAMAEKNGIASAFSSEEWIGILKKYPEFSISYQKYTNSEDFYKDPYRNKILLCSTSIGDAFKIWEKLKVKDWVELLDKRFIVKNKGSYSTIHEKLINSGLLNTLSVSEWETLIKNGHCVDDFNKWDNITVEEKLKLLNYSKGEAIKYIKINEIPFDVAIRNKYIRCEFSPEPNWEENKTIDWNSITAEQFIKIFKLASEKERVNLRHKMRKYLLNNPEKVQEQDIKYFYSHGSNENSVFLEIANNAKKKEYYSKINKDESPKVEQKIGTYIFICTKCSKVTPKYSTIDEVSESEIENCPKGEKHDWFAIGRSGKPNCILSCKKCNFSLDTRFTLNTKLLEVIAKKPVSLKKLTGSILCPNGGEHDFSLKIINNSNNGNIEKNKPSSIQNPTATSISGVNEDLKISDF